MLGRPKFSETRHSKRLERGQGFVFTISKDWKSITKSTKRKR